MTNALYIWENAEITTMRGQSSDMYKITVTTNPKVVNRRKYPRMPISNKCTITVKQNGKQYNGQMINISAGGFAFSVRDNSFPVRSVLISPYRFLIFRWKMPAS